MGSEDYLKVKSPFPFPGNPPLFPGPVPSLLPRPSSIELLRTRSIKIASTVAQCVPAGPREPRSRRTTSNLSYEEPPKKTRAHRNRHHNDGVFFVALVNIMVSDFPSPNEAQGARLSSHSQTCERCASRSATLVRQNPQFKHCHVGELHGVVLSLPHSQRWAEIPLLANNFSEGTPVIR